MISTFKKNITLAIGSFVSVLVIYLFVSDDGPIPLISVAKAKSYDKLNKLPDFSKIKDVKEKKELFFNTLYPIIKQENEHVLKLRKIVILFQDVPAEELSHKQKVWLNKVATHYKVDGENVDKHFFTNLLERVDVIPPSLALTQAAIESGWGSSRFSKQGNNIFGQWCFSKGCGMVPSSRDLQKSHEVAKFSSINESVRSYIRNLNTNASYKALRKKRGQLRQKEEAVTGLLLAQTLDKYSEEGHFYVAKISQFINQNKLQRFTAQFN
ncbi:glucosaminidase domain-containing protein [Colwellia sp. RE-S-Sl-9]